MYRTVNGSQSKLFSRNEKPETPEGETHHQEVLWPLIKVAKTLGSWPRCGSQFILRLTPWNGLTLFILHFYTVHKFFNWMTVVKTTENIFQVFEQLTLIIRTGIVAICFDYRFANEPSLNQLFRIIGKTTTLDESYSLFKLKTVMKVIVGVCCFFICLHVLFASVFMFHSSTKDYVNWLFYGDSADAAPDYIVRTVMIADWGLYLYLVICNECFFFGMFIAICLIMLIKIRDYNAFVKRLAKEKVVKTASQVQELYQMHVRLSEMIGEAEKSYSLPTFLWILCIIFNLAVKIESIIRGIKKESFNEFGYIFTDVTYYSLGFMAICMVASEIGDANSEPIISINKIAENGDIEDWGFQQETQLLITKINTPMLKLSGWDCFELNMKFMLTIIGALATYSIIIIQMA